LLFELSVVTFKRSITGFYKVNIETMQIGFEIFCPFPLCLTLRGSACIAMKNRENYARGTG